MKVFLSWSGERSKAVAEALHRYLPLILHYAEPWMSRHDIRAGERWALRIGRELQATDCGIICLTRDNLVAPWILFEAGAISKVMEESRVYPYSLDAELSEIGGPLGQFQAKKATEGATLEMISALNEQAAKPADRDRVAELFRKFWPDLKASFEKIPASESPVPPPKPETVMEELVGLVRGLDHRLRGIEASAPAASRIVEEQLPAFFSAEPVSGLSQYKLTVRFKGDMLLAKSIVSRQPAVIHITTKSKPDSHGYVMLWANLASMIDAERLFRELTASGLEIKQCGISASGR